MGTGIDVVIGSWFWKVRTLTQPLPAAKSPSVPALRITMLPSVTSPSYARRRSGDVTAHVTSSYRGVLPHVTAACYIMLPRRVTSCYLMSLLHVASRVTAAWLPRMILRHITVTNVTVAFHHMLQERVTSHVTVACYLMLYRLASMASNLFYRVSTACWLPLQCSDFSTLLTRALPLTDALRVHMHLNK